MFIVVDCICRTKEIICNMAQSFKIDISYKKVQCVKTWVITLRHSPRSTLCFYQSNDNLKLQSPGIVTYIERNDFNLFRFFFMVLGCSIKVLREYYRLVICIDDAFFKGKYHWALFITIGKDGNYQIYPITFVIG